MTKIAPSILTADFGQLDNEIKSIENADYIHIDVMDGVFVPNLSFGFPILESVRKSTNKILDVHLMIKSPSVYATRFAEAGGDIITFHIEAETPETIMKTITDIHNCGKKAGISLKPGTPAEAVYPYIENLDLILVMTVEPGYGGQEFMAEMLTKITELREYIDSHNLKCEIEVDGGINIDTAKLCIAHGANVLVAGIDVFNAEDRAKHINELRGIT
ncbi:MAG: ribulose-phosphate 3-epimerase [Oscillospiraceae bacterium]|jgi:ribulose-phosphate 3-epimerase|nr:ribulose-phosphate 3-epimerase [Oscillospiraceae bacterium]